MNKKVLLVGCGSEIGSMLLSMNQQLKDKFIIDTVLTNKISNNEKEDMDSINARLILCNPQMIDKIKVDYKKNILIINEKKIKFFFGDINNFKLNKIKKKFNATIIATSKKHISNKNLMKKFIKISDLVLGVAESEVAPAVIAQIFLR